MHMDQYVKLIKENVDISNIQQDIDMFLTDLDFWHVNQLSLTSHSGKDDWECSIGKMEDLEYPEYYRWRLMKIDPRSIYTIHKDGRGDPNNRNLRLHIPIITNDQAYLMFFNQLPTDNTTVDVTYHNLKVGNIYEINTTNYHTAVNHGNKPRWHIVGVRYEK